MNPVFYFFSWLFQSLFRIFPIPCKTGLLKIGNPAPSSPVFLTGNFLLTVQRVKKALKGMDAYLLVANTHGMNVWCGAAGGHFTHHAVVSVLKTTGIEDLVNHRKVILPQLAATGVEAKQIREKADWKIIWGPVYAKDIPAFIHNKQTKGAEMRIASFPLLHRIEMALFWAAPISVVLSIPVFFFFPGLLPVTNLIVWGLSLLLFAAFPLYRRLLDKNSNTQGKSFFSFTKGGIQVVLFFLIMAGFYLFHLLAGTDIWPAMLKETILTLVIVILITVDLKGLTPLYFSGILDKGYSVKLEKRKCKGEGACITVCPGNCFEKVKEKPGIRIAHPEACVSCGACIVQCSHNVLTFLTPGGEEIDPAVIRRYKLSLMGKRQKMPVK